MKKLLLLLPLVLMLSGCMKITDMPSYTKECIVVDSYNENYKDFSDRYAIFDCNGERIRVRTDLFVRGDKKILHFSYIKYAGFNTGEYLYYEK